MRRFLHGAVLASLVLLVPTLKKAVAEGFHAGPLGSLSKDEPQSSVRYAQNDAWLLLEGEKETPPHFTYVRWDRRATDRSL